MSWSDETQKLFQAWADAQQDLWKSWSPEAASGQASGDAWSQALELWQRSMRQTLEAQAGLMKMWASSSPATGQSDWSHYLPMFQELFAKWTSAQQELWNTWFESLKDVDSTKLQAVWDQRGEQFMEQFSASTQKVMDAHKQAMDRFLEALRT